MKNISFWTKNRIRVFAYIFEIVPCRIAENHIACLISYKQFKLLVCRFEVS